MADLKHNSDLNRLDHVEQRDLIRVRKYRIAQDILAEDACDPQTKLCCKRIRLGDGRESCLCALYFGGDVRSYRLELAGERIAFTPEMAEQLICGIDPQISLPEAMDALLRERGAAALAARIEALRPVQE